MMRLIILLFLTIPAILCAQEQSKHVYIISFDVEPMAKVQHRFDNEVLIQSHLQLIKNQHRAALEKLSNSFNRQFTPRFEYSQAINGISLELSEQEALFMAGLNEVKAVTKDIILHTTTDATASMVKADDVWQGIGINPLPLSKGEDIIVGILDTGINLGHESFSDGPEDNYDFANHNPFGMNTFRGWCDPSHPNYDVSYVCNNKIIGAWDFVDSFGNENDGPLDSNFHGSHMAGVISGNYITAPPGGFVFSFNGNILNAPFISGIAPHTHIIMYDVCDDTIGCPSSAVLAAIDQAVLDGVDVINMSLSGDSSPWNANSISLALLNANNMGIISSTAAGNATSQQPNTYARVTNLAPWVMTIANSFHGRTQSNDVSVTSMLPVSELLIGLYSVISDGMAFVANIESSIFYSKDIDSNNEAGCLAWAPMDFDGVVALIKSSINSPLCSHEVKIQNAQDAGAVAVIIFNADSDIPQLMTGINSPTIPATMIGLDDAINLISYIQENSPNNTEIEILAETTHKIVDALGMVLYHSSLRGPNNAFNITKPDITAPGTDIFAAIAELGQPSPQYFTATGTSQATAVISGSMALLKSLRPTLSPSELKSVMMLSANDGIVFEEGEITNSDDIGSGMLDLVKAINTVLVMDESTQNYINANPNIGGLPKTLNLASLRDNQCGNSCSWSRTFTNKDPIAHRWKISTKTDAGSEVFTSETGFSLDPGQSITLQVYYIHVSGLFEEQRFGKIIFTDSQSVLPQSQLSLVVYLNDFIFNNGFE